jgi:hypothetical protein
MLDVHLVVAADRNGPPIKVHSDLANAHEANPHAVYYLLAGKEYGVWALRTTARALEMLEDEIGARLWASWTLRSGDISVILFSAENDDPDLLTERAIHGHQAELITSVALPDSRTGMRWHSSYRPGAMANQPFPLPFLRGLPVKGPRSPVVAKAAPIYRRPPVPRDHPIRIEKSSHYKRKINSSRSQ